MAREIKLRLYRTSVLENLNVDKVFSYLARQYIDELRAADEDDWAVVGPTKHIANGQGEFFELSTWLSILYHTLSSAVQNLRLCSGVSIE